MGKPAARHISLQDSVRVLGASFAALPSPEHMEVLIADSQAAEARGYYDPLEDERLRETYSGYLAMRVAIWEMIHALRPRFNAFKSGKMDDAARQAFGIAFCGAEIIVRTGEYLIGLARRRDIVWQKLDEAEPRYGLKRKSFTRLYRQLTSAWRMHSFYQARDYFDANRDDIFKALQSGKMEAAEEILRALNLPSAARGDHLRRYRRFLNFSLRRRRLSTGRKTMFALFEMAGSDIAELKIPLVKQSGAPKRVTLDIISALKPQLRPGDVFITRHDDAMSNLFLPGFWPHGALYVGTPEERRARGIEDVFDGFQHSGEGSVNILEAKKDGVLLRPLEETLQVDAFTILRPKLSEAQITQALSRGLSHAGKLYDFIFDFSAADRMVCTEVIYRAFHGTGKITFELSRKAGRSCLSAEDFLNQAIANDWFEAVFIYGVNGCGLESQPAAHDILRSSFAAQF